MVKIGSNVVVKDPELTDLWEHFFVGTVKQVYQIRGLGTIYKIQNNQGKYFGMKRNKFTVII